MRKLEFAEISVAINTLLDRAITLLEANPATRDQVPRLEAIRGDANRNCLLRVVLTGHFSAGKSTLVRALTGADVAIGAGVTTTTTSEHRWCNVHLVDTPGIHSDRDETEHDRIAREATVGADLILFVVSNEQFSGRLGRHFRRLADPGPDGLGLAAKMIVVVNKIDRESGDHDADIVQGVSAAIAPHDGVPILLCSAGQALLAANATTAEMAAKHQGWSRFDAFVPALDRFVHGLGATGQLVTPLQRLEDALEAVVAQLSSRDASAANTLTALRAQKRAISGAGTDYDKRVGATRTRIRTAYDKAAQDLCRGLAAVDDPEVLGADVERALGGVSRQIEPWIEELDTDLRSIVSRVADELGDEPIRAAGSGRESSAGFEAPESAAGVDAAGARKVATAGGKVLKSTLKSVSKDAKALRETVLAIGHALGHKFRPHEAVKLAGKIVKGMKFLEKALPLVGVALELYLTHRAEKAEQEQRRYVQALRSAVVRTFCEAADAETDAIAGAAAKFRASSLDAAMKSIEQSLREAASTGGANGATAAALVELVTESRLVRQRVVQA